MPKQKSALEIRIQRALDYEANADKSQNSNPPASIDGAIANLAEAYTGKASEGKEATKA
jgi:hypothetical protein